jgi:Ca2+-binding EF-hand superfamily protein
LPRGFFPHWRENVINKLTLGLSVAALALGGAAYAAPGAARDDPARDGVTTRAEAQQRAARTFERLDANRDGKIDAADRAERRAERLKARFERLDANNDGQLSAAEFNNRPALAEGRQRGEMRQGQGMRRMAMRGHGRRMGMAVRTADADRDGAVTQAEYTAAALQRFERLDANRDGQVTREERQAVRAEMRERRMERMGRDRGAQSPTS